jgi:hypothetical protein
MTTGLASVIAYERRYGTTYQNHPRGSQLGSVGSRYRRLFIDNEEMGGAVDRLDTYVTSTHPWYSLHYREV